MSPRERIIPEDQSPGEPAKLSFEDAEKLREKRIRKAAERGHGAGRGVDKKPSTQRDRGHNKNTNNNRNNVRNDNQEPAIAKSDASDPWAKWRK